MLRNLSVCLMATTLACACGDSGPTDTTGSEPDTGFGILMFGDSGYHLDYPDQDDYLEMFTGDEFRQKERADWLEDKRPAGEFEARPSAISPVTNRTVPASGMDQISAG